MPNPDVFYVVDRLEGGSAVLVSDDEDTVVLPKGSLPKGAGEGAVLRVDVVAGKPDWGTARLDDAERRRRLDDARRRLDRLSKGDSGGDISI